MKIGKFGKILMTFFLTVGVGLCDTASAQSALTVDQASSIVTPFYNAINDPSTKDISSLVKKATSTDWISCDGPQDCRGQKETISAFSELRASVPDLTWQRKDLLVSGNDVIVRGEFTGTPTDVFMGVTPTGQSFGIMSIDIHTIKDGKMVHSYHVENWGDAIQQLTKK